MKKLLIIAAVTLTLNVPIFSFGEVVTCTNCSTVFTQLLEQATNLEQLSTMTNQYSEAITQTAQQIQLVQHAIQNTMQLPQAMRGELAGQMTQLANLTNQLRTQRGDYTALAQVFNQLFPAQSTFSNLTAASTAEEINAANQQYRQHQDKWSASVDEASLATYQLTGRQLQDLSDAGTLETYVQSLLDSPDGQMKAMQAGNQLAALQLQEQRELRELVATSSQSTLASQMKAEKKDQLVREQQRKAMDTSVLEAPNHLNDPLPIRR
jgi:P-type conjugative transfer protein TrbJ